MDDELLDALTRVVNRALSGDLPASLQRFLCGGRLVPLKKKDEGIRPLVVGECLRSLIAKLAVGHASEATEALHPLQVGVGGAGPWAQAAVLTMRSWVDTLQEDEIICKLDLKNAYNRIKREACLEGVEKRCPEILAWSS